MGDFAVRGGGGEPGAPQPTLVGSTTRAMASPIDQELFRRIQDRVAIVGIGHLPFAKDIGRPISDTAVEAIQLALDDAGLVAEDVDGMSMLEMEATH